MSFIRRHFVKGVTGRCIAQIRDFLILIKGIDQGRQAGRFARKSSQHDAAAALVHQRGERFATVARRAGAFEYHFVATRPKPLDPPDKGCRTVKKRGIIKHPDECNRKTYSARMIQNPSAIVQHAIDLGNRKERRLCQIFLLHVCKQDDRNAR